MSFIKNSKLYFEINIVYNKQFIMWGRIIIKTNKYLHTKLLNRFLKKITHTLKYTSLSRNKRINNIGDMFRKKTKMKHPKKYEKFNIMQKKIATSPCSKWYSYMKVNQMNQTASRAQNKYSKVEMNEYSQRKYRPIHPTNTYKMLTTTCDHNYHLYRTENFKSHMYIQNIE